MMKINPIPFYFFVVVFLTANENTAQTIKNTFSVIDGHDCTTTVSYKNEVQISKRDGLRIVTSNAIPKHTVAPFPNTANPNIVHPQKKSYQISLKPIQNKKIGRTEATRPLKKTF